MEIVNQCILSQGRVFSGQSLQDLTRFTAVSWWKTEYDFIFSQEKREMINSACREAVASKNALSSRICSFVARR